MSEVLQAAPAAPKRAVILNPQRRALAEQWRQDWVINAAEGETIEDVLDPGYWAHVASEMQKFDRVEVRIDTGEWVADLIVIEVGRNWAAMHLVKVHELRKPADSAAMESKHEVLWRGNQHKWCVKRKADGAILSDGMADKATGLAWLANYEQVTRLS